MYSPNETAEMPLATVKARSLANSKKVTKPAIACMGAQVLLKEAVHEQTVVGIAKALGVSVPYINIAMSLPADLRAEIAAGKNADIFREIFTMLKVKKITAIDATVSDGTVPFKAVA